MIKTNTHYKAEMRSKQFDRLLFIGIVLTSCLWSCNNDTKRSEIGLTLIPPTVITNQVDLDIRVGIRNNSNETKELAITIYLGDEREENVLHRTQVSVAADSVQTVKYMMETADKAGDNHIMVVVRDGRDEQRISKSIRVIPSATRSTKTIGGAWIGFYHWSEEEGKMWNPAIKEMTEKQWAEMIASMHKINMDVIVIQESFRNQEYVGKHDIETNGYKGKAYYPSKLFPDRMPIAAKDPIEAVLSEADKLGMHVFMGVGLYAWFDYSKGSLAWHKRVAKELFDRYGHHPSFYGWYVSEEGMGSLDSFETDSLLQIQRRQEILSFFKEFRPFVNRLAPEKPLMFAPNGWGVGRARDAYPKLLKYVDIISPFAFARMPEGDLSGKEAVTLLQKFCDDAGAHLWLDLEAFLFNEKEGYLYPRPFGEIRGDLALFDSFEKVICYQYPGVFSDPDMSFQIGEAATRKLFLDYQRYLRDSVPAITSPVTK